MAIARVARRVIEAGREASGRRDIRCTVSIGGFVPKPHTPFQWAAQCDHETVDARLAGAGRGACAPTGATARSIGFRYHDGKPSMVEGLLSRGDRRVGEGDPGRSGRTAAGSTAGASTSRSSAGSAAPRDGAGRRPAWTWPGTRPGSAATARCCPGITWTPGWTGTGCGRTGWTRSTREPAEVEDCRWTPCFECGVCPAMDTEIETGPTGAAAAADRRGGPRRPRGGG